MMVKQGTGAGTADNNFGPRGRCHRLAFPARGFRHGPESSGTPAKRPEIRLQSVPFRRRDREYEGQRPSDGETTTEECLAIHLTGGVQIHCWAAPLTNAELDDTTWSSASEAERLCRSS